MEHIIVFRRQHNVSKIKEDYSFLIKTKEKVDKNFALKEFKKLALINDVNYTKPVFSYSRTIPSKTFIKPDFNVWKQPTKMKKGVKYYVVTWKRFALNIRTDQSVNEYFHLLLPASKANPNDGTAEYNRLCYLDLGYTTKKRNTELAQDKAFWKYWYNKKLKVGYSSAMYVFGTRLFDDLDNLPDILNHWYEVPKNHKEEHMYKFFGFRDKDVKDCDDSMLYAIVGFVKTGSSIQECRDYIKKSLAEKPERERLLAEIKKPIKLSKETRKMIRDIFKEKRFRY